VQSVLYSLTKNEATKAAVPVKEEKHQEKVESNGEDKVRKTEQANAVASSKKAEPTMAEVPKAIAMGGASEAPVKAATPAPATPAAKSQETVPAESLEELMQKFASSDGQDDQALTDRIIREVEASDREQEVV
jgi:hypothetical protein